MKKAPHWESIRRQMMLDPEVINLNTGSFGPLPGPVFEYVTQLRERLAAEPMDFLVRESPALLWATRERLAQFLGANPSRLVFMANVSAAVNTVANSLRVTAPGEILLTDHEYGAMHWCWERFAQRQGMTLRTFSLPLMPTSPEEIVQAVCAAFSSRTRIFFFSHVLSPTGLVLPATRLCQEARQRGILTVIDGAHAPAMIPLNLEAMNCDFYGGNCHKWMLAPTGSGFLFIGSGNEDRLQPSQVSWGWKVDRSQPDARNNFGATHRIYSFEFEGTRDPCAWLAISRALQFQEEIGWDNIRAHNEELVCYTREKIGRRWGLPLWTPSQQELHGFLTTFRLPDHLRAEHLRNFFWEKRIEVPLVERPYGLLLRISTHFYNNKDEIDRLSNVLAEVLK